MFTQDTLKNLMSYCPETWLCFWLPRKASSWNSRFAGKPVGSKDSRGYLITTIFGKPYAVHRLIFLHVTGTLPNEVDHRNKDKADNRWCNLREATRRQNSQNRKMPKHNTSGFKGVGYDRRRGKWFSKIGTPNGPKWLGYHPNPESASLAYKAAALKEHQDFLSAE